MEKLSPKLIVFDWDDVITLGAKDGYFACYDFALERVGVTLPEEIKKQRILKKWGTNHREELTELLQEHTELIEKATKAFEDGFFGDVFVDSLRIIDGTLATLNRLAEKYKLAVATGGHPRLLKERIIPKFRIPPVFEIIVSGYEVADPTKTKPNPYMLDFIMDKLHVKNTETISIGDAENDVLMARNASVEPVVVLTGHLSKQKALRLGVRYVIPDITALETILEQ
jgi:phosphoglycolate phosphatase